MKHIAIALLTFLAACDHSVTGPSSFTARVIASSMLVGVSTHGEIPGAFDLVRRDEDGLRWLGEARATGARPLVIVGYWSPSDGIPARCARAAAAGVDIEFWNEPNLPEFWGYNAETGRSSYAQPDPRAWVDLLRQCREAAPGATLMGPALGGSKWDWRYLEQATAAGMMNYLDVVTVHGYATDAKRLPGDIDKVRRITGASRVGISEWGFNAGGDQSQKVREALDAGARAGLEFLVVFHAPSSGDGLRPETVQAIEQWRGGRR